MTKPRCTLVLVAVLGLSLFLMFPAEDLAETAYDESELLPYETTLETANLIEQAAALTIQRVPRAQRYQFCDPIPPSMPGSSTPQARLLHQSHEPPWHCFVFFSASTI